MGETVPGAISVAMCTYNGERFVAAQLESVARQSLTPHELIVCDDGSTDGTLALIERFASAAPFAMRMVRNETTLGPAHNFERAISMCNGEFIALADQDDVWLPRKLEALHEALARAPGAGYAFCNADLVDEAQQLLGGRPLLDRRFPASWIERAFRRRRGIDLMLKRDFIYGTTLMLRARFRELWSPMPGGWSHDTWICHVLECFGHHGVAVFAPLVLYRVHGAQHSPGLRAREPDDAVRAYESLRAVVADKAAATSARPDPHAMARLDGKIAHLRTVAAMRRMSPRARVEPATRELLSGRWFRFSPRLFRFNPRRAPVPRCRSSSDRGA